MEPLHDLKGHIRNVWDLLPNHLPPNVKAEFEAELKLALGPKDQYRGSDYRLSAILVYLHLKNKCPSEFQDLLLSLVEICRFSYQRAEQRTPKSILRLYNMTFLHACRCLQIFGENPKLKKIYGIYYHAIVKHLAEVNRLIAPSSLYTESEERIFGTMRGIGRTTSLRSADFVRDR